MKRKIAIVGSTGSIGTQALQVVEKEREHFFVAALTAHRNAELLIHQARKFSPAVVGISDESQYEMVKLALPGIEVVGGADAHALALEISGADTSLISVVGFAGLAPLIKSIELGLHTCVANKESIVCGGRLISEMLRKKHQRIYPVDSEHSAIFQCLAGNEDQGIRRILLTCSGGPFRTWSREKIAAATVEQALKHPNWSMGGKITVDSATLANKGLEVLEAQWLFGVPVEKVEVVVHPQSIIHSMVEYEDCSILAQMGYPDMKLPIQYALHYPERLPACGDPIDFPVLSELTFEAPDLSRFPALRLAYESAGLGDAAPIAFNAANDIAVEKFFHKDIGFYQIAEYIECAIQRFSGISIQKVEDIFEIDRAVREYVLKEMDL